MWQVYLYGPIARFTTTENAWLAKVALLILGTSNTTASSLFVADLVNAITVFLTLWSQSGKKGGILSVEHVH